MSLLEPGAVWAIARPVWYESWHLHLWVLSLTSWTTGIGLAGCLVEFPRQPMRDRNEMHAAMLGTIVAMPVFIVLFLGARGAELLLTRMYGPPNGRMDRAGALTVLAHSLSPLLISGVAMGCVGLARQWLRDWEEVPRLWTTPIVILALGLFWSLLLTRWGARELRHANRLKAWTELDP